MDKQEFLKLLNSDSPDSLHPSLHEVLQSQDNSMKMPVALGKDVAGHCKTVDLVKSQNLLIAGAAGSGKSTCIHTIILSLLCAANLSDVHTLLIDTKTLELSGYNGLPNLLVPVVTTAKMAISALSTMVSIIDNRFSLFAIHGVKDIRSFNDMAAKMPQSKNFRELSSLLMKLAIYLCLIKRLLNSIFLAYLPRRERPALF